MHGDPNVHYRCYFYWVTSGRDYRFQAYTTNHQFRDVGAVYIFTREENNSYYRLYIGQTYELGERLLHHEKWACARRHNVNSICVLFDGSRQSRLNIETDLLRRGLPPCND